MQATLRREPRPASNQCPKILDCPPRGEGEARTSAWFEPISLMECDQHFRGLEGRGGAIDHGRVTDLQATLASEQKTGQDTRRNDDIRSFLDERRGAVDESRAQARERHLIPGEGGAKILRGCAQSGYRDDPIGESVALRLLVVPDGKYRINGNKSDPASKLRG